MRDFVFTVGGRDGKFDFFIDPWWIACICMIYRIVIVNKKMNPRAVEYKIGDCPCK